MSNSKKKNLILIGGGFAGLSLIKNLANNKNFNIILIDKKNYHFYHPFIYDIFKGEKSYGKISFPFRELIKKYSNVYFIQDEVKEIQSDKNHILTFNNNYINYDYLIIATGIETNFYSNQIMERKCFKFKNINDAIALRSFFLSKFEDLNSFYLNKEHTKPTNIHIVGGGLKGVELAINLAQMKNTLINNFFPYLDPNKFYISILEMENDILNDIQNENLKNKFKNILNDWNIYVKKNCFVKRYMQNKLEICKPNKEDNIKLITNAVIWCGGVKSTKFKGLNVDMFKNRIPVHFDHKILGYHNIYAIGDCSVYLNSQVRNHHSHSEMVSAKEGEDLGRHLNNKIRNYKKPNFLFKAGKSSLKINNEKVHNFNFLNNFLDYHLPLMIKMGIVKKYLIPGKNYQNLKS